MASALAPRSDLRTLKQLTQIRSFASVTDSVPLVKTGSALQDAIQSKGPRLDWTKDEIREIYNTPLMELSHQSVRLNSLEG